ncbi:biopolymer transporter ExbD [Verrucomicrobiaceae bacterium R5-34]|uniref:Biopolymer transporter ExbD n=1 Tax=Oceaniferula flava TaxID=2800421 RepID=A0AAE2VDV8_9BACT|nr:biopolymer transporter ExbD [Oceaniferula flavus]MBK1829803.1 biopolymer transporter ExbD [Verrucomicrobiaceae bacterium R5-34]MBK1856391.1 biopolymer transporter ExbD [Oceaniferula flavus]MBM1137698.1 biopolymer transporter ExbD [Oceaniferula flavus]
MASSKLRNSANGSDDELQVDMSPMIDMVFLLLIFFIVASTVIVVKQDPNVDPPVADSSKKPKDGKGRIVINVRKDGSFYAETATTKFDDEEAITEYVKEKKLVEEGKGLKPIIHLRGDQGVSFKYVRTVIRASANAGVDNVVFSVYGFEKN